MWHNIKYRLFIINNTFIIIHIVHSNITFVSINKTTIEAIGGTKLEKNLIRKNMSAFSLSVSKIFITLHTVWNRYQLTNYKTTDRNV